MKKHCSIARESSEVRLVKYSGSVSVSSLIENHICKELTCTLFLSSFENCGEVMTLRNPGNMSLILPEIE